jgi:hypothetical protein
LTSGLIGEIESLFPSRSKIKNANDNKRDPAAFQHKIAQLFPAGCIFASFKQLYQGAEMFLGAWALRRPLTPKAFNAPILQPTTRKTESMLTYPKDESLNQL